jgi:CHASE3 domain sensor protein
VFFFVVIGVVTYVANDKLVDAMEKVEQSHELLSNLHDVQADLFELVSAGRGYLLTGTETYLQSFQKLKLRVTEKLSQTRKLTDKPYIQEKLNLFEPKLTEIIRELENLFELQKQKGPEQVGLALKSGKSQHLLEELERLHDEIGNSESKFLDTTDKDSHDRASLTKSLILLSIPTMAILLALSGWFITSNIAKPIKEVAKISEYISTLRVDVAKPFFKPVAGSGCSYF